MADETELLEGEEPDIWQAAKDVAGEKWMIDPNVHFGFFTPEEMVKKGKIRRVRSLLRTIKYVCFS